MPDSSQLYITPKGKKYLMEHIDELLMPRGTPYRQDWDKSSEGMKLRLLYVVSTKPGISGWHIVNNMLKVSTKALGEALNNLEFIGYIKRL